MGRSTKEQAEHNRVLIIEKASELFRARGIDDVGVSDVMKAAGLTVGGFYKHFSSKEELAKEAARLAFNQSTHGWHKIGATGAGSIQKNIAEHYFVPKQGGKRCPLMAFGSDLLNHDYPGLNSDAASGIRSLLAAFASGSAEVKAGVITDDSRKLAMFAAMVGANYLSEVSGDAALSASLKNAVLDMF